MTTTEAIATLIADFIAAVPFEEMTQKHADALMTLAHSVDPTESTIAAELRDVIRDNTELDV